MPQLNRQKLKLLYLLRMLEQETDCEKGLTMAQILSRLEDEGISAERKSVYRDIAVLREFGYDVKMYQRAPVEYALDNNDLSLSEVTLLIDSVQSCKFLTERTSGQLVKSLRTLVSEREREQLEKRVHVQGRIKSQNDSVFSNVDTLHLAIYNKKKIHFLYYKYDTNMKRALQHDGKPYELTPVKIVFADGFYYLVAWNDNHSSFSRYRIDRMRALSITDKPATHNELIANYDFEDFEGQSFGMFDGELVTATLKVKPEAMDVIADRFGVDVPIVKSSERQAEVRVNVRVISQFFGWVAGLNGSVKIASPKKLVGEYNDWLRSLIEE